MRAETRRWHQVVAGVRDLLDGLDPYGLEPGAHGGAPADEYDPEAADLAQHLLRNGGIDADAVDAVWARWFDEPLSAVVDDDALRRLVERLDELVRPGPG